MKAFCERQGKDMRSARGGTRQTSLLLRRAGNRTFCLETATWDGDQGATTRSAQILAGTGGQKQECCSPDSQVDCWHCCLTGSVRQCDFIPASAGGPVQENRERHGRGE